MRCKQCGPLPGLLFPVNDSPEIQRCDACDIFASDADAGQSLFDFMKRKGIIKILVQSTSTKTHLPAELGLSINEDKGKAQLVLLDELGATRDFMRYETTWMGNVYRRVADAFGHEAILDRHQRSEIILASLTRSPAESLKEKSKARGNLCRIYPRTVKAGGVSATCYVVVETTKKE